MISLQFLLIYSFIYPVCVWMIMNTFSSLGPTPSFYHIRAFHFHTTLISKSAWLILMLILKLWLSNSGVPQNHLCSLLRHDLGSGVDSALVVLLNCSLLSADPIPFSSQSVTVSLERSHESRPGSFWSLVQVDWTAIRIDRYSCSYSSGRAFK